MNLDNLITVFDNSLRTVFVPARAARANPAADLPEAGLNEAEKREAEALMRVNHVGEVCAQALYQGQALASPVFDAPGFARNFETALWGGVAELAGVGAGLPAIVPWQYLLAGIKLCRNGKELI